MKCGTIIKLPSGGLGTICYHNLDGYGGIYGEHRVDIERAAKVPPEFMLRDNYPGCDYDVECIGEEFEIIKQPEDGQGASDDQD